MGEMQDAPAKMPRLDERDPQALDGRGQAGGDVEAMRQMLAKSQNETARMRSELQAAQASLKARFTELAVLTKLLKEAEDGSLAAMEQRTWILRIYSAVDSQPWWSFLAPRAVRAQRLQKKLRRMKIFDAQQYLKLYPDIAAAGMDPVRHYILHGMAEGRRCPV